MAHSLGNNDSLIGQLLQAMDLTKEIMLDNQQINEILILTQFQTFTCLFEDMRILLLIYHG
jgi:hypothetical protein